MEDLQAETHHRGCVLILRLIGHAVKISAFANAVEDEFGDVDRIAVYNSNDALPASSVLPRQSIIAIKEPYYKVSADGECVVRVDHPSDLLHIESDNIMIPGIWRSLAPTKSAIAYKIDGNAALKKKDYAGAHRW